MAVDFSRCNVHTKTTTILSAAQRKAEGRTMTRVSHIVVLMTDKTSCLGRLHAANKSVDLQQVDLHLNSNPHDKNTSCHRHVLKESFSFQAGCQQHAGAC